MPVVAHALLSRVQHPTKGYTSAGQPAPKIQSQRPHQDKIASAGEMDNPAETFGLVHTPVPPEKIQKIPKAKEALDVEWSKLTKKNSQGSG